MTDECCDAWGKAQRHGTDCEAYGPALRSVGFGRFMVCGMGEPVRFCPWCGASKNAAHSDQSK